MPESISNDIYILYFSGLSRLQQLHRIVNSEEMRVVVDSLRLIHIENCYALLRHLDSRTPSGDKYIILDLSTERALEIVLKQASSIT